MAKQRLVVYVPEGVYREIMDVAARAERPAGWVVTQAWNRAPISPLWGAVHAGADDVEAGLGIPLAEALQGMGLATVDDPPVKRAAPQAKPLERRMVDPIVKGGGK